MNTGSDESRILGRGTYGIITSEPDSTICRKIFTKDKALSLIREAYIIKRLSHINGITEMINLDLPNNDDVIRSNGSSPWGILVMNRYNITLSQWLRTNPSYSNRMRILIDIIRILSQVHANGIVHADIKLENIMLTVSGEVRIIDWGLSGPSGYARIHLTTKTYRPKRIIQDFCHDIYSLGILAIEILLGSILINNLDYYACIQLLKDTNLDPYLKKLLIRMIHPDCIKRPDIFTICKFFSIPQPQVTLVDTNELITIPAKYGITTMEYPNIFSKLITNLPKMITSIYAIIGAVYTCNNPHILIDEIEYEHICYLLTLI